MSVGKSAAISSLLSAMTTQQLSFTTEIMFYINLGFLFCALTATAAVFILYRKTSYAAIVGLAALMLFGLGLALFFIQLFMYVFGHSGAVYAVYLCLAIMYSSFILAAVYCFMLSKQSLKALCITSGTLLFVPPFGAIAVAVLSYKMTSDTSVQEYVYNGYAYTYAALAGFCSDNPAALIDGAGDEEFDRLDKKQIRRRLKSLKKSSKTPDGKYAYAAALATYAPEKMYKSIKLMKKAADAGVAPALFNLGYYHELGVYVKQDLKKAKALYARAAEAGDIDASLRLCIADIKSGDVDTGIAKLKARADNDNDLCALYDLGVCHELGIGVPRSIAAALDIYTDCARKDMFVAQKRIFALAATDINSAHNGEFFRSVTDREFSGTFAVMISGLIEIKKRRAADAAEKFLTAVKRRDKWEGLARCLVGTLYIDNGEQQRDRVNGAEYVRSAVGMLPTAKDVLAIVPQSIRKLMRKKPEVE